MTEPGSAVEVNFDGLVGPTHNYAGLSLGNRASMGNAGAVSSPRRAAIQGLRKMRLLTDLGLVQGLLPPQWRPDTTVLRALGFGSKATLAEALAEAPDLVGHLVPTLLSSSSMWAANAATVSPSADTADGRVHLTPANLSSTVHRSFESGQTTAILQAVFSDGDHFEVHPPLPHASAFADEGAANHGRLTATHGGPGIHLFVYGRTEDEPTVTNGFPRRQTRLAGRLIQASHGLDPTRVVFARQASAAIDAGAFHNDVVSVINEDVVFAHQHAFLDGPALIDELQTRSGFPVRHLEVPTDEVPLTDAIASYLFNSQLVTLPVENRDGSEPGTPTNGTPMTLIAPQEVEENPRTAAYLRRAVDDPANPIGSVNAIDLRESMRNGGGPACLRLRVVLTDEELSAVGGRVIVDDRLLDEVEAWVERHYRDELHPADLTDPNLEVETAGALDELTDILSLGPIYPFQR